ncbi:MAG: type I restriction enzyme HsdR N-terminal domain-containing protein, partial [Planctomycetaceae bacterium]|jgi:hypothetical protein|nr:type I restriction enzyme HsdR N-terminal domain-containing protein [Planctomycetaceae bacterium]
MDFKDQIRQLGKKVSELKSHIQTEEATKNAFIMPFIGLLGFDVYDPREVVPEYVTDIGTKKGEKIDYAIFKDSSPIILVECKHWEQNLSIHEGQLLRYYHVSPARFGILTNGIQYRFYSDLEAENKMDEKPFLEFDITSIKDVQINELKKFHKTVFDVESITNTASELKYTNELRQAFHREITEPSEAFVKHFAKQAYGGMVTSRILEQFTVLLKRSITQYINDLITERFKSAMESEEQKKSEEEAKTQALPEEPGQEDSIITTEEELEGFRIIKAILCQKLESSRITYRDSKSYFAVLLDDNARKPLCRLYFNSIRKKHIGIFNDPKNFQGSGQKNDVRIELESLEDIYKHSKELLETVDFYLKSNESAIETPSE